LALGLGPPLQWVDVTDDDVTYSYLSIFYQTYNTYLISYLSVLRTIFPGEPGLPGFIAS